MTRKQLYGKELIRRYVWLMAMADDPDLKRRIDKKIAGIKKKFKV